MASPEVDIQSKSPNDLLREQVLLLREINASLIEIKKTQDTLLDRLHGVYGDTQELLKNGTDVYVTDVNMPFASMVGFILKWSFAAIPAGIILFIIGGVIWLIIGGFLISILRAGV